MNYRSKPSLFVLFALTLFLPFCGRAQLTLPSYTIAAYEESAYLKQRNPNVNISNDNTPNNYLLIITLDTAGTAIDNFNAELYKWEVKIGSTSGGSDYLNATFDATHPDNVPARCNYSYSEISHVIKVYLPDASAASSIYYKVTLSGRPDLLSATVSSAPKSGQLK